MANPIILVAKSDIAGRFAPVHVGTFETVGKAEEFGFGHFKTLLWAVAREASRKNDNGETKYDFLSQPVNARRPNVEA